MSVKTTYEAVNAIGTVVHTFSDRDLARAWARKNAPKWPGVKVEEVVKTETRKALWTDHKFANASRSVERQGEAA